MIFILLGTFDIVAQDETQDQSSEFNYVPGQVICLLHSNTDVETILDDIKTKHDIDVRALKKLSRTMNLWLLEFDSNQNIDGVVQALDRLEEVQLVQLNHTDLVLRNLPNDSLFYRQWSFLNDGNNGGSGLADIDATLAWDLSTGGRTATGDTIVVAVIDQGFDVDHVDLIENMFINHGEIHGNNIDDDGNGYIDDRQGWDFYNDDPYHPNNNHGTHVSGTIGAKGDNHIGVTGVNWDVKILPVTGSSTLESTVVEAYAYVLELRRMYNETNGEKGAYIVATNSSFGVDEGQPQDYPIWCAMYDSLGMQGILSAGATANDNINIDEVGDVPTACASNFLISVTNMRSTDEINGNAGFGVESIDIGAPGTGIYSTFSNNNYGNNTGTSMATPHVAGALGLMYAAVCPDVLSEYETNNAGLALFMKDKLLNEGVDELNSMTGLVKTGGRLNLNKAIQSVSEICLQLIFSIDSSTCGNCDGSIKAIVAGNSGNVSFSWSTGAMIDSISDLCPGIYTVTAIDGEDTFVKSVALSDNGGVELNIQKTNITCHRGNDGFIMVEGGFNYQWSNGVEDAQIENLEIGEYFLTATDSLGNCTTSTIVTITQPDSLYATYQFQMPTKTGGTDGTLTAIPVGGTMPYSYLWDTGDTNSTIMNSAGKFGVTITDGNGCEFIDSALLGYPLSIGVVGQDSFRIWPNPASKQMNFESNKEIESIRVFDGMGRMCAYQFGINANFVNMDISHLNSGVYHVSVIVDRTPLYSKLVVTHE